MSNLRRFWQRSAVPQNVDQSPASEPYTGAQQQQVGSPFNRSNSRVREISDDPQQATGVNPTSEMFGIFELAKNPTRPATVDVVAVHGLQGHPYKTWQDDNGINWLKDFLPKDVPDARILTFGYDSSVALSKSVAGIEDHALRLLNTLFLEREIDKANESRRPIVFICHSLGGIVVKKALILAHEDDSDSQFKAILSNTRAVAFIAVPHRGSAIASFADVLANALKGASIGTSTNTALISSLKKDSAKLADISRQFVPRGKDLKIYTFYETRKLRGVCVCGPDPTS
jgi:hypothetical protein